MLLTLSSIIANPLSYKEKLNLNSFQYKNPKFETLSENAPSVETLRSIQYNDMASIAYIKVNE